MADPVLAGFYQHRISTAYQEQLWAVTIVSAMNAFVAGYGQTLVRAFPLWQILTGISLVSLAALIFVWGRHAIFAHYDALLRTAVFGEPAASGKGPHDVPEVNRRLASWSGVTLYSLVILVLWRIAWGLLAAAPTGTRT